ncbi:MAG: metalloregulator ArsR/SmtB family transcription factor [Cypionkella sp.]|uniref:ArsR/SmtB family transcription factor n=1 Tax=Cypionkella sp. TaxID=2811411 RepID=UPI002ABA222D|nr:metalloregulator ArsR/SmtB family transcription factor [Cypionkella sp.]MDZ4311288.1 metalloregulator ArsR/SmtB family transcription factor [Cypionkella sp.]
MIGKVSSIDGLGGSDNAAAEAVSFLKILSHEARLQILCLLLDRDMSVGELAATLGLSQPTASQQLMRLRAEGYLGTRRTGKAVVYHLLRPDVKPVIAVLRTTFCPTENGK